MINKKQYIKKVVALRSVVLVNSINNCIQQDSLHLAHMYSKLISKMMSKYNVHLTLARFICKKCSYYLLSAKTCHYRKKGNFIIYHCLSCDYIRKYYVGCRNSKK